MLRDSGDLARCEAQWQELPALGVSRLRVVRPAAGRVCERGVEPPIRAGSHSKGAHGRFWPVLAAPGTFPAPTAAESIDHGPSALAARCERGVLQHFGTQLDCTSCIAVHASFENDVITVRALS